MGSGTLANDVVAAQISLLNAPGVIVSNGEFGERLIDHATRMQIPHTVVRAPWGERIDSVAVAHEMQRSGAGWLWAVHCETSTGVMNDLEALAAIARSHGAKLALDVISSLGTVPLSLRDVWMASAVSGKALAAFPGVALVFHDGTACTPSTRIPRYLDLGFAVEVEDGVLVPVLRSANRASLSEMTNRYQELVDLARERRLPAAAQGGSIATVTNFGTFGLEWATPIPLPEQTLVLGLGAGRVVPRWDNASKQFQPATEAQLTLSFDHRVLDGGGAGRLLGRIAELLENPSKL